MKFNKILLMLFSLLLLTACSSESGENNGTLDNGKTYFMTARVDRLGEDAIEVTVIEAPHGNSGPFWVLTSDATELLNKSGDGIKRSDLAAGDTVRITWGGQVMMSYPPKISALKIEVV